MHIIPLIKKSDTRWFLLTHYLGRIDKLCISNKIRKLPKTKVKTFTWIKVENKTLFDENFVKVPVWSNKINNLQISFSPLRFKQNIPFRKMAIS